MKETYFPKLRQMEELYASIVSSSRSEYVASLKPGQTIPPDNGKILGESGKERFHFEAEKMRQDVISNINATRNTIKQQMAAAPAVGAVHSVQLMEARSDLSQTEVKSLLDLYSEDYQACRAILDVAQRKGVVLPEYTPVHECRLDALNQLEWDAHEIFSLNGFEEWAPGKREFVLTNDVNAAYPD